MGCARGEKRGALKYSICSSIQSSVAATEGSSSQVVSRSAFEGHDSDIPPDGFKWFIPILKLFLPDLIDGDLRAHDQEPIGATAGDDLQRDLRLPRSLLEGQEKAIVPQGGIDGELLVWS